MSQRGFSLPRRIIICIVTLSLGLWCNACFGGSSDAKPALTEDEAIKNVVLLVFDPTVLNAMEAAELSAWLDRLGRFYLAIPEDSSVALFLVGKGVAQKPPVVEQYFGVDTEFEGEKRHVQDLKSGWATIRSQLEASWKRAHQEGQVKLPSSCIISSLYAAKNYIARYSNAKSRYRFFLVVVSDMIESCDEWGRMVSVERGTAELDHLRGISVDLSAMDEVTVVQVPNHYLVTPVENDAINVFWRSFFERSKVKPQALTYSTSFPDDFGSSDSN